MWKGIWRRLLHGDDGDTAGGAAVSQGFRCERPGQNRVCQHGQTQGDEAGKNGVAGMANRRAAEVMFVARDILTKRLCCYTDDDELFSQVTLLTAR